MELLDLNINEINNNWTINDAIRELVANAIDEHLLAHISNEIKITYNASTKTLMISDEGRGIKSTHFIENINKEKLNNPKVFGKLGINLKNAIAVLVNNHINVTIKSDFGIFTPIIMSKQGLNEQIPTIHIQRQNNFNEQKGTLIYLSPISQQQADQANNLVTLWKQGKWIPNFVINNEESNFKVNELSNQLKITQDELASATKDANDTHQALNNCTSQLATIIQRLADSIEQNTKLKENLNSLQTEKTTLLNKINDLSNQIDTLNSQLKDNGAQKNDFTNKLKELQDANEILTKQNNELFNKTKDFHDDYNQWEIITKQLNDALNKNKQLTDNITLLNQIITNKEQEINDLTKKLNETVANKTKESANNSCQASNDNNELIIQKNKEIARLNTELSDAKFKIQSLNAINPNLKNDNENFCKENIKLKNENERLTSNLKHLQVEMVRKDDYINNLNEQYKNLKDEKGKSDAKLDELTNQLNDAKDSLASLSEFQQKYENEKEVNKLLGEEITKLEVENSKFQQEYKKIKDEQKADEAFYETILDLRKEELDKIKNENCSLKEDNEILKSDNESKEKQINALNANQNQSPSFSLKNLLANPPVLLKTCSQLIPTSRKITVSDSSYFDNRHAGHPRFLYFEGKMHQVGSWEQITKIICDGAYTSYGNQFIDAIWKCNVNEIYDGLTVEDKSAYRIYFANQSQSYSETFSVQIGPTSRRIIIQYKASAVMRLIRFIWETFKVLDF